MPRKGELLSHCNKGHLLSQDNRLPNGDGCKECKRVRQRVWQAAHPDRMSKYRRAWLAKQPPGYDSVRSREFRKNNPESVQNTRLKQRYGITKKEQDEQLARQDNSCAICETEFGPNCKPETDHDHSTQKVREQLCHSCNVMLGQAKDNPDTLRKAADYLERFK